MAATELVNLETKLEETAHTIRVFAEKFNSTANMRKRMQIYKDVTDFVSCSIKEETEKSALYRLFLYLWIILLITLLVFRIIQIENSELKVLQLSEFSITG